MPSKFSSGKYAIAECDRCDQRYMLKELRIQTLKTKPYRVKVCKTCWDPDQPQLQLGMYPVDDPQAVRQPRPDTTYDSSGTTGLMTDSVNPNDYTSAGQGTPAGGSRDTQWGWNPVGGASNFDAMLTPNYLVATTYVGTVTITGS